MSIPRPTGLRVLAAAFLSVAGLPRPATALAVALLVIAHLPLLGIDACGACTDTDGDGVCDTEDTCPTGDDRQDADGDGTPDACDACPTGDDRQDSDGDGTADACDACTPQIAGSTARGGDTPVLTRGSYDYVPSIMHDGLYRMWWCGGIDGDAILYAEASSLDGPWHSHTSSTPNSYDVVFTATGNVNDFDGTHTCDPSVVRVDGVYYMYYGGYPSPSSDPAYTTRIGVARSNDGYTWERLNGGRPIINPNGDWNAVPNAYGAGQPSALSLDGYFYLIYTDTTGVDVDGNGGGQFVLRSTDPTFHRPTRRLPPRRWEALAGELHRSHHRQPVDHHLGVHERVGQLPHRLVSILLEIERQSSNGRLEYGETVFNHEAHEAHEDQEFYYVLGTVDFCIE